MLRARGIWWSIVALNFLYAPGDPANLLMLCQEIPKSLAVKPIGWRLSFEGGGRPRCRNGVFRIKTPKFGGKFQVYDLLSHAPIWHDRRGPQLSRMKEDFERIPYRLAGTV